MRVFWVNHFGVDEPQFGESDLKPYDKDYVKVDGHVLHAGFVWPATPENLQLYSSYVREYRKWQQAEPNMFLTLNQMKRS